MVSETMNLDSSGAGDHETHNILVWMKPETIAAAARQLAEDIFHQPKYEAVHIARFFVLKLRDVRGSYWTIGINTLDWYRHDRMRWHCEDVPEGRLEGPVWLRDLVQAEPEEEYLDNPYAAVETEKKASDPILMLAANIEMICREYQLGHLTSQQTEELLQGNYLIDKHGNIWTVGARNRSWYALIDEKWQTQLSPLSVNDLPNEAELEPLGHQVLLGIANLFTDKATLPELPAELWKPPRTQPEVYAARCCSCGVRRKPGEATCYQCGADTLTTTSANRAEKISRICSDCGYGVAPEDLFCTACGKRIEPTLTVLTDDSDNTAHRCNSCGAELATSDRFCTQCGIAVTP